MILLIPLIFLLPMFFENKVFAVFLAEPISDFISVVVSAITFFFVFGGPCGTWRIRRRNLIIL